MFAGLKIYADLQKNNVENGAATSQQPTDDTSSESESMLDDVATTSTPKKLPSNRKRLNVISSESEDESIFEDLMHEPGNPIRAHQSFSTQIMHLFNFHSKK
jgi:hypothetical protein